MFFDKGDEDKKARSNSVSLCSDNSGYNAFGSIRKNHDLPDASSLIGKTFRLTYMGSTLEVTDK
jgi:hypothetical protein